MHNTAQPVWTDLVYVLAPGRWPAESVDQPVTHGSLHLEVRSIASIVVIESGEHVVGIDPVDEVDLSLTKSRTVDRHRVHSDVPESDGVQRSLHQYDVTSSYTAEVKEKPPHVDALGIAVLGTTIRL